MTQPRLPGDMTCDEVREAAGAFVLGALEADEAAAVRAHLATCPEAHAEIEALGGVLSALATVVLVVEPPTGLKARVMAAAAADRAGRGADPAARSALPPPRAIPAPAERAARRWRGSWGSALLGIAAVLAIALLGGWNLLLQNDLSAARSYEQAVAAVLDTGGQPGSLNAILSPAGGTGSGLAAVDSSGNMALAMRDLAPTSGGTVYEAWVIGADNVPVPLGSFQVGAPGTAAFRASGLPTSSGIVLALTLELGPGATTPRPPIIAKGVASADG